MLDVPGSRNHAKCIMLLSEKNFTNRWTQFRTDLEQLAESLDSYAQYLDDANNLQNKHQSVNESMRQLKDNVFVRHAEPCEKHATLYNMIINNVMVDSIDYDPIFFEESAHLEESFLNRMAMVLSKLLYQCSCRYIKVNLVPRLLFWHQNLKGIFSSFFTILTLREIEPWGWNCVKLIVRYLCGATKNNLRNRQNSQIS